MSLSRVEIVGFKSFMNPVVLEFREGITAVLGPNGCGKTNIVDAIRWVLGEQSAKQLRGVKMENVIFNGTEVHKPMGYAEVSITINNEKGLFPLDYSEIRITRKVYRSGISEYFINKSPCRLRDIKELFADTGTGSHSYAVIEQDMIDDVLNDTHGERRLMFEEAAGIVKYRMRREEAQRKLKLTENDLVRLEDILEELKKQVGSLRYQVGKAKRYERLKERIREYELVLLRKELSSLLGEKRIIEKELGDVSDMADNEDTSLGELESELEKLREKLTVMESDYNELQNERYEIRRRIQSGEERIIRSRERRAEAQRRIEKATEEIEKAENRLAEIEERLESISGEITSVTERIREEEEVLEREDGTRRDLTGRISEMKSKLIELKQTQLDFLHDQMKIKSSLEYYESALSGVEARTVDLRNEILQVEMEVKELKEAVCGIEESISELQRLLREGEERKRELQSRLSSISETLEGRSIVLAGKREELAHERSRYELLKGMLDNLEGYSKGTRYLLERGAPGVRGPLADVLRVDQRYMPAVAASLNVLLDSVIVDKLGTARELLEGMDAEEVGAARIVYSSTSRVSDGTLPDHHGLIGRLVDFVDMDGVDERLVRHILERVLVFETVDSAFGFIENSDDPYDAVTLDGVYIDRRGSIYYGRKQHEDFSLIGRREKLREIEQRVMELAAEIEHLESGIGELNEERKALESESAGLEEKIESIRGTLSQKVEELKEAEKKHIMKREKVSMLVSTLDELEDSRSELMAKIEETRMTLDLQEMNEGTETADLESELNEALAEKEKLDAKLTERRLAVAALRGEYEKKLQERKVIVEMQEQFRELVSRRRSEIEKAKEEIAALTIALEEEKAGVTALDGEERECKAKIDSLYGEIESVRAGITEIEEELKRRKGERDRILEKQNQCRVRMASIETKMRDLVDRARDLYGEDLSCYLEGLEIPIADEEMQISQEDLEKEKRKIESLGPVNLAAVDEYAEKKERLEFLLSQKEDLERARDELNEAIRKINRRARRLFVETFDVVRKNFSDTFQILFEGGEADLKLSDGTDPLEADIVITARPKGKRLQDISLLSGGERALTALALLFALYKTKPSPFCIFDEVDAPLDDANIRRFVKMLEVFKKDTQFIIITHNKRTMEIAEKLYGVTMEEKGVSKVVSVDMTEVESILKDRVKTTPLIDTTVSSN